MLLTLYFICLLIQASSSARAAELLESLGGGAQGFMGLGGDLGYVPVGQSDEADSSVDADFRMLMRKLTKRDTTTKIKVSILVNMYFSILNFK